MDATDRRVTGSLLVLVATMVGLLAHSARAEEELPTADALIEKMITAAGGRDAMNKIKSRVLTLQATVMKMTAQMTFSQVDGKEHVTVSMPDGTVTRVVNGDHGWMIHRTGGTSLMSAEEMADEAEGVHLHPVLAIDRIYKEKKLPGIEKVGSQMCYKLELVRAADGAEVTWFVDKETFLPARTVTADAKGGKASPMLDLSDYRAIDGVQVAHKLVESGFGPMKVEKSVKKCEHNAALDPALFEPPPEIQALIDKKKAGDGAKPAEGGQPPADGGDKPTTKPKG